MGFIALVTASAVVGLASLCVARVAAREQRRAGTLVVAIVVFHVVVIGLGYLLGLVGLLTATWLWLSSILTAGLLMVGVAWREGGREPFVAATRAQLRGLLRLGPDLLRVARIGGWPMRLAIAFTLLLLTWLLIVVTFSPPRGNSDALFYHEAIVAFMIQNQGLEPVSLPGFLQRINGMPRFCHLMQLWFAIFTGRTFVEMPNLLAHALAALSVYGLARHVGVQKSAAIGWSMCFTLTPGVLRLTDVILVDTHSAALVLAAVYCAVVPRWTIPHAFVAALAAGLVVGTKYHLVPLAGAACLIIGVRTLAMRGTWSLARIGAVIGGTASVVLTFLAAVNLRNYLHWDNPLWPAGLKVDALGIDWRAPSTLKNAWASGKGLSSSGVAAKWFSAPFSTRPWQNPGARVEDYGAGGTMISMPIAALCCLLAPLGAARRWRQRGGLDRAWWSTLAIVFVFLVGWATFPSPVRGRYYLALLGLSFVLTGWTCATPRRRESGRQLAAAAVALMMASAVWAAQRGWIAEPSRVWARLSVPAAERDFTQRSLITVRREVGLARADELKAGMTVGFDGGEYIGALWNDDYSSRVVFLKGDVLKAADKARVDWLYLHRRKLPPLGPKQPTWEPIGNLMGGRRDVRSGVVYRRVKPATAP